MKRMSRLLAVLLALSLIAAACGSDDEAADQSGATEAPAEEAPQEEAPAEEEEAPEEEAPAEEEEAPAEEEEAPAEAAGDPILIGFVGTTVGAGPGAWDTMNLAIDAATQHVNDAGGIDGRPIEVLRCDDSGDPNLAADCAQQHIDAGVVTFASNFTTFGETVNPVIIEAGRAIIGGGLFTPGDFGVPEMYATNGGAVTSSASAPMACSMFGAESIGVGFLDVPAGQQVPAILEGFILGPNGLTMPFAEPIAPDTADFAPLAAKVVSENPDCFMLGLSDDLNIPGIQAVRAAGYDGLIAVSGTFVTADLLVERLGDDANGVVLGKLYDQQSEGWQEYADAVAALTGDDSQPSEIGVMAWLGVLIAADVIAAAGDDPAAVTAAIPEVVAGWDTGGLTATPLDWSVAGENPLAIPNLRDVSARGSQIIDGVEVPSEIGWLTIFGG